MLQPKTDIQQVLKIRYVAEWSVKWEIMRKPPITQCRKCQRFNHTASNCQLQYRCVKCLDQHEPGKCSLDSSKNTFKPTCVNCKGEHTANNAKLCPAFQKQVQIKEAKKEKKQTKKNTTEPAPRTQTKSSQQQSTTSYAAALKPKPNSNKNINTHPRNHNEEIVKESQKSMRDMMEALIESQSKLFRALISEKNGCD